MITKQETDWRNLFTVEEVPVEGLPTRPGDCNANCQMARELVCVCRCGGKNHGSALKQHVKPLDEFSDPIAQTFNPQEYQEELAVPA